MQKRCYIGYEGRRTADEFILKLQGMAKIKLKLADFMSCYGLQCNH
jgi:hypothetical protein